MEQTVRYEWVDYAKVLSICFVISYHVPPRDSSFFADVISMLRMPAFFLIAGYLFRTEKFTSLFNFIRHRGIQLLIPYTSFFILFYILWLVVGRDVVGSEELAIPIWKPLVQYILGTPSIVLAPYWFVCCLFVTQVVYYFLAKTISRNFLFVLCLLVPYLNCLFDLSPLPWQFAKTLNFLPFYGFANILKTQILRLNKGDFFYCFLAFSVALLCVYGRRVSDNEWICSTLYTLGGLLMLPLYIWFCKQIPKTSFLVDFSRFVGRNSIIILAVQNYMIGALILIANRFYEWPIFRSIALSNIVVTIGVLMCSLILVALINRYAPFMIGRKN